MQEGIVIKSTGSWYEVRNESGEVVLCRLRGKIRLDGIRTTNPVAVGDKVIFEKENNKDTCVINKILPRYNVIVRKSVNLSKASHIIASNIDQAILVATIAHPRTSTGFMDRFLVTAEAYHIPTTIVFNKCDLYDEEQMQVAQELISIFENIGYHSFMVSAKSGFQCDELKEIIEQKGGKVTGSVTSKTQCLINNDITSNSGKNKKAKELQIPILTEEEFMVKYLTIEV